MKLVKIRKCSSCGGDIISDRVTNNLTVNWAHPRYVERRHLCPAQACRKCGSPDTTMPFRSNMGISVSRSGIKARKLSGRSGSHIECNTCKHEDFDHPILTTTGGK